jgi:hypothetical protein
MAPTYKKPPSASRTVSRHLQAQCSAYATPRAGTYKTQSLSFNEEGNIQVEATFFPTNDQGISLIAEGFDDPDNWEIEGAI